MKRLLFITLISLFSIGANAQLFSSTGTLSKGEISLGIHPVIIDGDAGVYLRGTIGTVYNLDVNVSIGVLEGDNYVGADIKKPILNDHIDMAFKAGIHFWGDNFGFDGALIVDYDIQNDLTIFSGIDADLNADSGLSAYFWLPLGVEYKFYPNMTFIGELDLGINDKAHNIWQVGIRMNF
jgi:hypothetical protein